MLVLCFSEQGLIFTRKTEFSSNAMGESLRWDDICKFQILARQQAQREEELAQTQRHILALQVYYQNQLHLIEIYIHGCINLGFNRKQEEIEELERENRLHSQQVWDFTWELEETQLVWFRS